MRKLKDTPPHIRRANKVNHRGNKKPNDFNYKDPKWVKITNEQRINNPICGVCGKLHIEYTKLDTDHIIPIKHGGAIWDKRNHQSICKKICHPRKSAKEKSGYNGPYRLNKNRKKIPLSN